LRQLCQARQVIKGLRPFAAFAPFKKAIALDVSLRRGLSVVLASERSPSAGEADAWTPSRKPAGHPTDQGRIEGRGLAMRFDTKSGPVVALDDLDIDIRPGEFVALLGPSGCGKSTLLNLVAGILKPTSGSVTVDGKPVKGPNPDCGIVFQNHSLFPWMSVLENVAFGPKMLGRGDPIGTARTFLSLVGLERQASAWPSSLSGGMQQRVGIARALATYPPVLLMDEPFGALDAQTRSIMQEELLKIWSQFKTTVIFVTHDIEEAIFLADRVVVMKTLPGGVKRQVPIDLPRPREPSIIKSELFNRYRGEIFELIREETLKVFRNPD
jgi:NitT/TauT family transport system ATP-binding protein